MPGSLIAERIRSAAAAALRPATQEETENALCFSGGAIGLHFAIIVGEGPEKLTILLSGADESVPDRLTGSLIILTEGKALSHDRKGRLDIITTPRPSITAFSAFGTEASPAIILARGDGRRLADLAAELLDSLRPTVRIGSPQSFAEACKLLRRRTIMEHGKAPATDSIPRMTSPNDIFLGWPLDPDQWRGLPKSDARTPLFDACAPTLSIAKPDETNEFSQSRSHFLRPATLSEFIRLSETSQNSAHDKLAALELLRESSETRNDEPRRRHREGESLLA
jgi:hypothetical protein